eukprot:113039-Amphidinium_carterae.1
MRQAKVVRAAVMEKVKLGLSWLTLHKDYMLRTVLENRTEEPIACCILMTLKCLVTTLSNA